jgi:hypothetical protein
MIGPRLALALALVVASAGCRKMAADHQSAPSAPAPAAAAAEGRKATDAPSTSGDAPATRRTALEIRVDYQIDVTSSREASDLVASLSRATESVGGFVENASIHGEREGALATFRVPPDRIEALRAIAAGAGRIGREDRSARDVTDALADLAARLRSAKAEEGRLLDLLEKRTGNLADVLAAERALADVRTRIERLEADDRSARGRVDFATVTVRIAVRGAASEESAAAQLALAAREGVINAREFCVGAGTLALRVGPTMTLALSPAVLLTLAIRRRRRAAAVPPA